MADTILDVDANDGVAPPSAPVPPTTGEPRPRPEPSDARKALVKDWIAKIQRRKRECYEDFRRMDEDRDFVSGRKQWPGQSKDDERYRLNLVQRHVNQTVAAVYAKNPRVIADRRRKRDFKLWDESPDSLQEALQTVVGARQAAAQDLAGAQNPQEQAQILDAHTHAVQNQPLIMSAMALLKDVYVGAQKRKLYDSIADTMELLAQYAMDNAQPRFKTRLKKCVKRVVIAGVGYIKLGFLRKMGRTDDWQSKLSDINARLAYLKAQGTILADNPDRIAKDSAEMEALTLAMRGLVAEPEIIVKAGLTFDFPLSHRIIIGPGCTQLVDFVGAEWVAEEFMLTKQKVLEIYGCDLGDRYTGYSDDPSNKQMTQSWGNFSREIKNSGSLACVWEVYDPSTGLVYAICDGHDDFMTEPQPPQLNLERFYPIFPLVFNEMENENSIYPESDVRILRSPQIEYNRMKEALRQHRIANIPRYVAPDGTFDKEDQNNLAIQPAHTVMHLKGLADGDDIAKKFQRVPTQAIDVNLYNTADVMEDIRRGVGTQEANLGGTSGDTATEVSVAQTSEQVVDNSQGDDMDDMLSDLWRCAGQVLLMEMDPADVVRIVGDGAVWPTMSAQDVADEIYLKIEAGSSGRPNKAQDLANFQRLVPFLVQSPGIKPIKLLQYAVKIMDDRLDPTDFTLDNAPSIQAINSLMGKPAPMAVAGPPGAQGPAGGANQPQPPGLAAPDAGGGQPAYPAPGEGSTMPVAQQQGMAA